MNADGEREKKVDDVDERQLLFVSFPSGRISGRPIRHCRLLLALRHT